MTRATNARLAGVTFLLVAGLPLQLVGLLGGSLAQVMWLPMLAFEVPLAVWLLVKGVPARVPGPIPT